MAVYACLTGASAAGAVVADEVGGVVFGGLEADGVFELADDVEGGEEVVAGWVAAFDAFGCYIGD